MTAILEKYPQQSHFFSQLKNTLPVHISLVDEIADLLNVSNDSAYRRIRCETALTIDEALIIASHFNVSMELLATQNQKHTVNFRFNPLRDDVEGFANYVTSLRNDMMKVTQLPNSQLIFAAEDIPIFHHFNYPNLSSFKMFYWNKSILHHPHYNNQLFTPFSIPDELMQQAKEIYTLYCEVSSIEIWTKETINSTYKQIEFYWDAGLFESQDAAILVCDEFLLMLKNIEQMASVGKKTNGNKSGDYQLFASDIMIGNNSILVKGDNTKIAYLSHHTFNSMATVHNVFCEETDMWLKNLIKKSILLSDVSEKQRYQFFRHLNNRINELKNHILSS